MQQLRFKTSTSKLDSQTTPDLQTRLAVSGRLLIFSPGYGRVWLARLGRSVKVCESSLKVGGSL